MISILIALILSACSPAQEAINSEGSLSAPESSVSSSSLESSESESSESISEPEQEIEPEPVPEPVVTLSSNEVERGSYFTVKVENLDLYGAYFTDFLGYERPFLGKDGDFYAFVPIKTAAEAGEYNLSFSFGDFTYSETVTVTDRDFPTQYLTVAPSTLEQTLEDQAVRAKFDEFFQKYRFTYTGVKMWDGEFVLPLGEAYYKETTKFGSFRTFSNGATEWHNATDMAAKGGTPVYATNRGRIIFADYLGLTGNTIVIDHGYGVLSWHYHLRSLDTEKGAVVEKGELIGKVGTTGLSTGNHLHFGISVGGIFVDPMAMIGNEPEF